MVQIVNKSKHEQLVQGSEHAAGYDIRANVDAPIILLPRNIKVIPTGVYVSLPEDIELQVRPRSGLSIKGITVINTPGTIDADYRGEIKIILINHSSEPFAVEDGQRIAQVVFNKVEHPTFVEVDVLTPTVRGSGGFGSTGEK